MNIIPRHVEVMVEVRNAVCEPGHRDLIHSTPNALATTANYLKAYGWQRGEAWMPGSANFDVLQKWNASEVYTKRSLRLPPDLLTSLDARRHGLPA
jgi:hypothetical protein